MKIVLQRSAVLKLANVKSVGEVEVPHDTSIGGLLSSLGVREEQHKYLLCYVNGKKKSLSCVLQEGDRLQLFLPIGGG